MLEIHSFVLGPFATNAYLVADTQTNRAVAIDPGWDGAAMAKVLQIRAWRLEAVWLTHAHFDHFAGVAGLIKTLGKDAPVALHPADMALWQANGEARSFGIRIDPGPEPSISLEHLQVLTVGEQEFQVRHAPGHTPGHVIFYCQSSQLAFCGDVIFLDGIGRTDFPGGSYPALRQSIQAQILTLPDDTRLLCGHGDETSVGREREYNPFLYE